MSQPSEVQFIPYRQHGEPQRKAAIVQVDFPVDALSDEDVQVLGHLVEAADAMNPIFREQYEPKTSTIRRLVHALLAVAEGDNRQKLADYAAMIDLQNSPYALLPRKNCLLDIPMDELQTLAENAGGTAMLDLSDVGVLLTHPMPTPDLANFYPRDFSEEEFNSLGEAANMVNSIVIRDETGLAVVARNEDWYEDKIRPAVDHLKIARDLTSCPSFKLYLDAKIMELETGLEEARRLADYTWIKHTCDVDIVISTALEVYLDNFKNARGAASGGVYVVNREAEALLKALVDHVQAWEANAPWTHRRETIDPATLPKLKFVDVLTWAGDYVTGPFTTIAQSLPNDDWVIQNVGTVNMVYVNTGRAVHKVAGSLASEEFLTKAEFETVKELLFDGGQLHSALHEIGHTTGKMDPEHSKGQARDYLEDEYSWLEESRAELFGMWSSQLLVDDGVITADEQKACYDNMLISMITSLKFDPVQAHNKARNGMFHRFLDQGIIMKVEEDGKTKFAWDFDKAHDAVAAMLKEVGDLKASGNKAGVIALREAIVFTDDLKPEVEKRTSDFPLGRGLIFPRFKKDGDTYLKELEYADSFGEQVKFGL